MGSQQVIQAWAVPDPVGFRPIDLGFFNQTGYVLRVADDWLQANGQKEGAGC